MKRDELKGVVAAIVEVDPAELNAETDLHTCPAFDSVSILSLMIALDEQAGIQLLPEQAAQLQFYGEIEKLAQEQVGLED